VALVHTWDHAAKQAALERPRPGEGPILLRTLDGIPAVIVRADATLADLRRAAPAAVREVAPGVWELARAVWVVNNATLAVRAPEVRELRLLSRARTFSTLTTRGGSLDLAGTRHRKLVIRSWQAGRGGPDERLDGGRGAVGAGGPGRLDAADARFEDLGFFHGRLSGVAVTAPRGGAHPSGRFVRSDFVGNYFGAYTFEARDIAWIGNRFLDNIVYGLDPHDDSDGFLVQDNVAAGNGRHGIIFSRLCDRNVIRDNVSERNGWHGIVLDDGKRGDGPSTGNRIFGNVVRDNGKAGISLDGSGANRVYANRIEGQAIGIRLLGRSLGNTITGNRILGPASVGIFVDAPSAANAIAGNRVLGAPTAVRIRGADATIVRGNDLLDAAAHGLIVDRAGRRPATGVVVEDNTITGRGTSPILVRASPRPERRHNRVVWDYPTARDVARALGWVIGPGLWLVIVGLAALGPALFGIGGAAAQLRAVGGVAVIAVGVVAFVAVTAASGPRATALARVSLHPPLDPRLAATEEVDPAARPLALRILSKQGHRTHPTWYHDSQAVQVGGAFTVAWNGRGEVRAARLRAGDLKILDKTRLSHAALGGSVDSTGTDTDRHDVPALVVDAARRTHFVYGGGSVAARSPTQGPYTRALRRGRRLRSLSPERTLSTGGGAAFDFETVVDGAGVQHVIGQRGRGNTGSLVDLRLAPDGRWLAPRQLIAGGFRADACVFGGRPRGCNRFAIARVAVDTQGALHLVWGYSEASLGDKCRTDSGHCDNNLYYAISRDGGATWRNAAATATVRVDRGRSLAHDDRRFLVATGHIGLFKAVSTDRSGPLIVGTVADGTRSELVAWRLAGRRWRRAVIARSGDAAVRSWNGSLVLRHDPTGFTLWTPTGDRIFRFSSTDGLSWRRALAYRGAAWSLTGTHAHGGELLMWRGVQHDDHSDVMVALMPAGR